MKKIFITTVSVILFSTVSTVFPYTNPSKITIDWSKGEIRAQSVYSVRTDDSGIPVDFSTSGKNPVRDRSMAYDKAREGAVELIATSLRDIEIEPGTFLRDLLDSNPTLARQFGELIADRIKSREIPADFFTARCEARFRIFDLIRALPYDYPQNPFPIIENNPLATEYTSLIIDVRNESIDPLIFPAILDEDGREIYSRQFVNIGKGCSSGLVSYCISEKEARAHQKAGAHPYLTVALRSSGKSPVISRRDARKILSHKKTIENLRECRVIFIINDSMTKTGKGKHESSRKDT
jgi:hypothetical protein